MLDGFAGGRWGTFVRSFRAHGSAAAAFLRPPFLPINQAQADIILGTNPSLSHGDSGEPPGNRPRECDITGNVREIADCPDRLVS